MRHITLTIAVIALALAAPAFSGKGGNTGGNGNGNGGGNAGGNNGGGSSGGGSYTGTLTATPDVLRAGESFVVAGCGYDASHGNIIVGFAGGSWGSPLDGNGCFTIAGIPALSGDTLPAGTYEVSAYQYVHGKWTETGDTTVTVVD